MIQNWKTTSTGLLMILGSLTHLAFQIKAHSVDEGAISVAAVGVLGGLGMLLAADGKTPSDGPADPPAASGTSGKVALLVGLGLAGALMTAPVQAQDFTNTISLKLLDTATNVVLIPYAKYDLTSKEYGWGAAALYKVTDSFWAGLRTDHINGFDTSAGVQAQLKQTFEIGGFKVTPFIETSVGIGSSSLYGSAGSGAFVNFYSHTWTRATGRSVTLNLGLVGDYEHVVQNGDTSHNSNQVNAGPLINVSF